MTRKLIWPIVLFTMLFSVDAWAVGTYRLRSTEIQEAGGQWHIYVTRIELPTAPAIAHVPMKFIFTELMQYERALTDASKDPVMNRITIQNPLPKIEPLEVSFSDGTGKIFKGTSYDFSLTRARGYEAGEYKFVLRTSDGNDIGSPTTIILKGDNDVVDRRTISFATKAKDKDAGKEVAENENTGPASTEVTAVGTAPPFIPPEAFQKTDEEQIHTSGQGGCCGSSMIASAGPRENAAILAITVGLGLLVMRRKPKK